MKASRSAREANYRTLDSPCSLASITLPSCAHTPCLHTLVMAGSLVAVVPRSAASFPCKVICHLANSSGSARNIIACHGSSLNQWKPWGYPLECAAVLRQRLPTIKGRTARPPALQQRCWYGTAQTFRAAAPERGTFLNFAPVRARARAYLPDTRTSCAWAQPRRGRFAVMITSSARVSNAGGMIPSLCTLEIDNELEPGALLDVRSPELAPLRIRLPRS